MPQVESVGIYLDPTALVGGVKLEPGTNIALTRSDPHNSIIITDTRPPAPGCSSAYQTDLQPPIAPAINTPTFTTGVA